MPGECEDSNRLPNEAGESTERDVETMGLACGVDPSGMASKGNHGKWLAMHCLGFGACWGGSILHSSQRFFGRIRPSHSA